MTLFLPLKESISCPETPAFLRPVEEPLAELAKVTKAIVKARRIAVVCGAGISVQAGIPDFRSPEGLFQTLKRDNPKENLTSGKDLFDASVFSSENTTSLFCQMIGRLAELSALANPTPFHRLLKALDNRGKLLRVYTQNIDALEAKSGLTYGVPEFDDRRQRPRPKAPTSSELATPQSSQQTRLPSPPAETPRCVPLHGTLQTLHCLNCSHSFPAHPHVDDLRAGYLPVCPECEALNDIRKLVGKRLRGIGRLRPSVVLYNETHKDGEDVGAVVQRDLLGRGGRGGPDLLLVVGTSLRVPGTKRIVREFAKAARSRDAPPADTPGSPPTLTPSTLPSPAAEGAPIRAVYLNFDFPVPTREWEGVFDAWVSGDAQSFAAILQQEIDRDDKQKQLRAEQKRRREEAAEAVREAEATATKTVKKGGEKRKGTVEAYMKTSKRRKVEPALTKVAAKKRAPAKEQTHGLACVDAALTNSSKTNTSLIIRIPPSTQPLNQAVNSQGPTLGLIPEVVITSRPGVLTEPKGPPTPSPSPPLSPLTPALNIPGPKAGALNSLRKGQAVPSTTVATYGLRPRRSR